ncbi:hypothetical protein ZIOFF_028629 [Zingiber officinale]|uniref:Protein FAR1-RELATED SEQUENCE n=1 Tax=Zingiber officinale TaxID=94328 RepID=A0A8J5GZY6_ZINOF|nr:hypothetical protein ZIOFF_028629 [Zingiber officinale]
MEEGKFDSNEMKDNTDHTDQVLSPSTVEEVKLPEIGMIFSSEEEIRTFYNSYATSVGFGISKLGGRNGDDGKQKYFSIGCAKNRKKVSQAKNALHPRPSSKTNCKAKINVAVRNDGNFVITSVDLEHNHLLSPGKSRHFRCNKVLDSATKRKLELNDQVGITLSKSFHSCVVEAGGYENLSFDERKCRNYISEARRLRLGEGDAEALTESDEICSVLVEIMKDTKEKLIIAMENGQSRAGQLKEASTSGAKMIHSPLKVTELPFFASKVRLGRSGVEEVLPLGPLNEFERAGLEKAKKELAIRLKAAVAVTNVAMHNPPVLRLENDSYQLCLILLQNLIDLCREVLEVYLRTANAKHYEASASSKSGID